MSNRLTENVCVGCGTPLVDLTPQWQMCSKCIVGTKEKLLKMKKDKVANKRSPKRIKMHIPMLARGK
jgi:NMD protein affecting ribosome stability and mRNA decay